MDRTRFAFCNRASSDARPCHGTGTSIWTVKSIVKAPISPDGDVAGAVTDFVINLNADMDPAAPGKMLRKGQAIKIKLPAAIKPKAVGEFPVRDLLSAPDCKPGLLKCSTGVLLHGWPQHPILPTFPPGKEKQFSIGYDASTNTISYKIEKDLAAAKFWLLAVLSG